METVCEGGGSEQWGQMLPTRTENYHWTGNMEEAISDLEKAVCVDRRAPHLTGAG